MTTRSSVRTGPAPTSSAPVDTTDDALFRKVSLRIIPFLFLCYVVAILDRNNIGFAQLQMKHDLSLTDAAYSLGAVFFFIGYVLFEVPSNMLLHKFGARKTFARIMFLWGSVSVLMVVVSSTTQFYTLRFLLGVFEAGFFPGIVFYLTYWFPARRRAGALSIFYAGVAIAGVLGGLVSGWIMRGMDGVYGIHGWQWMLAIEGAPAVILGIVAFFYLKDNPSVASWLSAGEKRRLSEILAFDSKPSEHSHSFLAALSNKYVYIFSFVYFCLTSAMLLLLFWMPTMIKEFGITDIVQISLYSAIPNAIGAVGVIVIARNSDRRNERKWHFVLCGAGAAVALSLLTAHGIGFTVSMALLTAAAVCVYAAHPIFWSVPASFFRGPNAAASIALVSSIGVSSGTITPYLIGLIKTYTGSMNNAFYFIAALLVIACVSMTYALRHERLAQPQVK
ncbi:major facilitator transporter [Caballeronia arationis]|uniref:Sugar phosphate permease n=1 Tax=Caballeronia arationis TaxID=1777142 RepID=A0A7Z7N826_9BURK|nr:MFS transporter [Caballeronia arationis]SAL04666.1 major facilitator transporter [Caballeronia arationis]SOE91402.1 Sugar phosphate permease [Caballeronia arationis]